MSDDFAIHAGQPVLVEFEARGLQPVSRDDSQLIERSQQALDSAMNTIQQMGDRVVSAITAMKDHPPQEVEVEFGITLSAEAGALIAKVATEAAFTVKLKWVAEKSEDEQPQSG